MGAKMASKNDLLFAIDWLMAYEVGEDDEINEKARKNAVLFLEKEITKRIKRKENR